MNIRWLVSPLASALYAAECLSAGRQAAHPQLAAALSPALAELHAALEANMVPGAWWRHVVPLAAELAEPPKLTLLALTKAVGRTRAEILAPRLAGPLQELVRAYCAQFANLSTELNLRSGPLREHWDARGPGLLAALCRLVEPELLAPQAEVVLVEPLLGGHGQAHQAYNRVTFEAVLVNPLEDLPEVVRLGWLLSTLRLESGRFSERLSHAAWEHVGPLAMVPPVLAAASECELVGDAPGMLGRALAAWRLDDGAGGAETAGGESLAGELAAWWQTYLARRVPWAVALEALAERLGKAGWRWD